MVKRTIILGLIAASTLVIYYSALITCSSRFLETTSKSGVTTTPLNHYSDYSPFDVGFDIVCGGHPLQVELANILLNLCEKANVSARFRGRVVTCGLPRCSQTTTVWVPVVVGRSKPPRNLNHEYIVWNLDQPRPSRTPNQFTGAMRVWEFSKHAANIRTSEQIRNTVLPFLYFYDNGSNRSMESIQQEKDLDVCLLGAATTRRTAVVDALNASNVTVYYTKGKSVWGNDKTKLLERCKIVLNIHYYQQSVQEVLRILEGIAHDAVVVSESATLPTENDALLEGKAIHFVPHDATERHVEAMKLEVMNQLDILNKASAKDLWEMRQDSKRILNEWMDRGAGALQTESDQLLKILCERKGSCEHLEESFNVTKTTK